MKLKHILDRVGRARVDRVDRAFTLLEILIAVAALGVIAVGVAAIFAATGKTVTTGKRVSAFNAYASLIEQRLRADINSMIRDKGFLVIRNEIASGNTSFSTPTALNVPLFDGDEGARQRRVDEIIFFAKGEFQTARAAMDPSSLARSDTARIYFGHGQRRPAPTPTNPFDPTPLYYTPEVDDDNRNSQYPGGSQNYLLGVPNIDSPNQFASDWTLLRHVTLLCPPSTAVISDPAGVSSAPPYLPPSARCKDGPSQVALQPAAFSIFRALAAQFPNANYPTTGLVGNVRDPSGARRPNFQAGIVDIAATDLSVINAIYTTANVFPGPNPIPVKFFDPLSNSNSTAELSNAGVDNLLQLYVPGTGDNNALGRIHSWMSDAFPANSMAVAATDRSRMRFEPTPTNFVGAVSSGWPEDPFETAYRTTDQVMLSASNFLPRCTEFIVEWSFGKTFPSNPAANGYVSNKAGQLIWHGMERSVGGNLVAYPYISNTTSGLERVNTPYQLNNGTLASHPVTTELIHGFSNRPPNLPIPITSYFGSINPTFNPDRAGGDGLLEDPLDSASPTIPWAWPKLIRVTLSLADPSDPSIERTFQFVFQVPEPDGV